MTQKLVFFDIEAAGNDPKRHPIIQLAAIAVDAELEIVEAFESKLKFDARKAKAHSLRKLNYHPGVWAKEARQPLEVAQEFAAFLRRHATVPAISGRGESYRVAQLVAHNAAFDAPFVISWFEKLGIYLPARRLVLCTMQLAMWQYAMNDEQAPANFQLATLCKHLGVPFHAAAAHDALGDVTATVRLFQAMVQHSRSAQSAAA